MMGVNSVGGSGSGRGTSGSNSASGNDSASSAADAASKAEAARAEAAKAEAAQAEAAKAAEAAAIAAKVDFSVSSFTPAAAVTNMPSLTAPNFSMALASPTLNPSLTAPNFSAPSLMSATPLGPVDTLNPSLPEIGPVPGTKPEQVQSAEVVDGLRFGADANQDAVSAHTRQVLGEIMATANVTSARITSTARTPEAQARAMYDNLQATGVARQKSLYGANGDAVIDTYSESVAAGMTKEQTLQAMVDRINELGPSNVSKHLADPTRLNVIDISPRSIPDSKKEAFEAAIRAHPEVSRFLGPSNNDPAYHLEVRQP
ncbi:hypothetical protein ACN47A_33975 [Myxococcus fulvus]|uniref:hypothetical protein n=1 Tax=Myxococcus fulvus TaxID=33 RepID=UPI003B9D9310